jgi:hypothetical protein
MASNQPNQRSWRIASTSAFRASSERVVVVGSVVVVVDAGMVEVVGVDVVVVVTGPAAPPSGSSPRGQARTATRPRIPTIPMAMARRSRCIPPPSAPGRTTIRRASR